MLLRSGPPQSLKEKCHVHAHRLLPWPLLVTSPLATLLVTFTFALLLLPLGFSCRIIWQNGVFFSALILERNAPGDWSHLFKIPVESSVPACSWSRCNGLETNRVENLLRAHFPSALWKLDQFGHRWCCTLFLLLANGPLWLGHKQDEFYSCKLVWMAGYCRLHLQSHLSPLEMLCTVNYQFLWSRVQEVFINYQRSVSWLLFSIVLKVSCTDIRQGREIEGKQIWKKSNYFHLRHTRIL